MGHVIQLHLIAPDAHTTAMERDVQLQKQGAHGVPRWEKQIVLKFRRESNTNMRIKKNQRRIKTEKFGGRELSI